MMQIISRRNMIGTSLFAGMVERARAQALPQSVAELTRVATDVYMWRSIGHNTIFIVTDEGVIV